MEYSNQFSIVTQNYLNCYCDILETMIEEMTHAALNDSISHNFIVQMIPHHMAAIKMSKNLLCYTTWIPLQNIAAQIVEEQTKSIADMEQILDVCSKKGNTCAENKAYLESYNQITDVMFTEMQNAKALNQINADFIREMIPHHMGAVRMSENALKFAICPELIPILKAIITSQKEGICQMRRLYRQANFLQ